MLASRRKVLIFAAVGALAAAGGAVLGAFVSQSRSGAARLLGAPFRDLDGRPRRLAEWQGHMVLCNFWATWCAPCREEVPLLVAAMQQHSGRRFSVVGIGIDHANKIREFAANYGINYPLLVADAGAIDLLRVLGNRAGALPYSVLLDRAGRLQASRLGAFHRDELPSLLARALG